MEFRKIALVLGLVFATTSAAAFADTDGKGQDGNGGSAYESFVVCSSDLSVCKSIDDQSVSAAVLHFMNKSEGNQVESGADAN